VSSLWIISQTAVPPRTICRWSQRSATVRESFVVAVTDTVIFSDFVTAPKLAETIAHPVMVGDVVNGKVATMEPAATVMEPGRLKAVLVDCKVITDALARAAVKLTVQVPPRPGATAVGEQAMRASEDAAAVVIVRVAVLLAPLRVAVIAGV